MNYKFPTIETIDDVLPHVKDCEDFIIAQRDGFTIINYILESSETFRPLTGDAYNDMQSIIRRECRGIIFDSGGKIIRRPYHKFFNLNQREETIGLTLSKPHIVLEKLDGSMIAPFLVGDKLIWGTKMASQDFHEAVEKFVSPRTIEFVRTLLDHNITPIFEWMHPDSRIVINYEQPKLVLTAVREMVSGEYLPYPVLAESAKHFDIPYVDTRFSNFHLTDIAVIADDVKHLVGEEGIVVRFDDGQMVKIKGDWYVAIHKAKEKILYERYIVEMILNNTIDDVVPFLLDFDKARIEKYQDSLIKNVSNAVRSVATDSWNDLAVMKLDRKQFALERMKDYGRWSSIIFRYFDDINKHTISSWQTLIKSKIIDMIIQNTSANSKLEAFKKDVKFDMEW